MRPVWRRRRRNALRGTWALGAAPRWAACSDQVGAPRAALGLATGELGADVTMGVVAVVNAVGDVVERDGTVIAGTRANERFAGSTAALLRQATEVAAQPLTNTTLVAIVADARLDKVALTRLARQAHDGLALAISPVHTGLMATPSLRC